jgi:hypothetical protein
MTTSEAAQASEAPAIAASAITPKIVRFMIRVFMM